MAVTQKFIADKVGISQKTVSLYFQGSERVAPETRKKLQQIVHEYGYFPNLAARAIKTHSFKRIACVLVQNHRYNAPSHPHILSYINGASSELSKHGYSLVLEPFLINLSSLDYYEKPDFFKTLSMDGIIGIAGTYVPPIVDQDIAEMGAPVIWLNRADAPDGIKFLSYDERQGALTLIQHFLNQGKTSFGWFGPEFQSEIAKHYSAQDRYEAIADELAKHGIQFHRQAFARIDEPLIKAGAKLFASDNIPEVIIGYNFDYADAVRMLAMAKGIVIPRTMQITHFASDWESSHACWPYYTAVTTPETEMGKQGANYIMKRIKNLPAEEMLRPLSGTLHIGKSIES